MNALNKAIDLAGSAAEIARACGKFPQEVTRWKKKGFPPEDCCPAIEKLTGVRCEDLRTDLEWTRDGAGMVTGYHVRLGESDSARQRAAANEGDAAPTDGTPISLKQVA